MRQYFESVEKVIANEKAYIAIRIVGAKTFKAVPKAIAERMKARGYRWQKSYWHDGEFVERGWFYRAYDAKEFKFMKQFAQEPVKAPEAKVAEKPVSYEKMTKAQLIALIKGMK